MPEKSVRSRSRPPAHPIPMPAREVEELPGPEQNGHIAVPESSNGSQPFVLAVDDGGEAVPDTIKDEKVQEYLDQRVIGERIRALRLKRSMGLIELGTRTGLSASFLSQLETGRVVPTLRNLARIALVFAKDLSWFFRDDKPISFRVLRR